jgi:vacuolar protein sorting-associated protein 54
MKAIIRRYLPSSSDDDADSMVSTSTRGGKALTQQEKSSILARNLRALDPEDAEKLFISIYSSVSEALRRVSTQTKILLDVTSSMQAPEPKSQARVVSRSMDEQVSNGAPTPTAKATVQEELSQALDMSSLLGVAVDTAQTQITRVLKVRNEQSIRLSREQFLRYFTLNRIFADECEAVSGRGGNVLKGIINAQISGFVQVLGTTETELIASVLDNDTWNAEDFTSEHDTVLQRILTSMTDDPPEWTSSITPLWQDVVPLSANGTTTDSATNGTAPVTKSPKPAYINSTRFILAASAVALLSPLDTLLSLTSSLPTLTPQLATAILDLLRTFNSRTCQLILGAGATRSAGLKNITTKHLALASQALSFVIELVPYIREAVRRHLPPGGGQISSTVNTGIGGAAPPPGNVLQEFDKLKRLYQDHQSGIQDKLVEIMTSRSNAHVKAMTAINFDSQATDGAESAPSQYVETLTKETLTLHRVLSRHLSEGEVSMIMKRIFEAYREQWVAAYGKVDVSSRQGAQRLKRDGAVLVERLSKVDGFKDGVGKAVEGVLEGKIKDLEGKEKAAGEKAAKDKADKEQEKAKKEKVEKEKAAKKVEEEKGEVMFDADGPGSEDEGETTEKVPEKADENAETV